MYVNLKCIEDEVYYFLAIIKNADSCIELGQC